MTHELGSCQVSPTGVGSQASLEEASSKALAAEASNQGPFVEISSQALPEEANKEAVPEEPINQAPFERSSYKAPPRDSRILVLLEDTTMEAAPIHTELLLVGVEGTFSS